eukprot:CAMPEP_0174258114 /NCGR_PEP_ID=MMETSP0439-20130205/7171_1 /TAXON_ID=0 /ORGANISM="Stereomyxa ramosa, Strain Chinc5" /LENGTH=153 /DNA_ID=CAMNT_0015341495 /DNA_START=161 /DNA_END=619 /DNA_ORIENTATION=+
MAGEQKNEEFLKKNPLGKVPVLEEDGFYLPEGAAILAYIADSNNLTDVFPSDPKARGSVNRWLHWNHTGARKFTLEFLHSVFFAPPDADKPALIQAGAEKVGPILEYMNSHLEGSKFLAGDNLTLADIFVAPEADQLEIFGLLNYDHYPNIKR